MMVDYRSRSMGNVEQHLGNATSTTSLHYLWRNPRGAVLRIQALAMVAIVLSFVLLVYGSCRRWSNRWIVQKGFLAAQVVSLSLGTYSIGLMQSSSVKSEMYPVWAVSLLTLFGCMDPVTSYHGLEYKSPLLKMIFQLCLYCVYVWLMSVSSISDVAGQLAIGALSTITFIKSFHRSLALVLPSRKRNLLENLHPVDTEALGHTNLEELVVHLLICRSERERYTRQEDKSNVMDTIESRLQEMQFQDRLKVTANDKTMIEDVCLGYSLSHFLERHFFGLDTAKEMKDKSYQFDRLSRIPVNINYERTLKAIEVELAFLYEIFFTGNEFIYYYEAKTCSFWALASFIGICFVGVVTALPGTLTSAHHHSMSTGPGVGITIVVGTTTADLIATLVILVSLSLLQLVQLFRCWTSNWAVVAFACEYTVSAPMKNGLGKYLIRPRWWWWPLMRLKAFGVTRMNWFDNKRLWQDKLGQYSLVPEIQGREDESSREYLRIVHRSWICDRLSWTLGLHYIGQVLRELWGCDASRGAAVRLHEDVKASIVDFLDEMKSTPVEEWWWSSFVAPFVDIDNGVFKDFLPFGKLDSATHTFRESDAYWFTHNVMVWHIATWYCELAEQKTQQQSKEEEEDTATGCSKAAAEGGGGGGGDNRDKNRRVAIDLSKYCAYLVVSAPELLPGPSVETKRSFGEAMREAREGLPKGEWKSMDSEANFYRATHDSFLGEGVYLGKMLRDETTPLPGCTRRRSDDPWEVLARLWVRTLLYAAPYGDVEAHRQRLSQGGEFITHLWALLYHLGIVDEWEHRQEVPSIHTQQVPSNKCNFDPFPFVKGPLSKKNCNFDPLTTGGSGLSRRASF